MSTINLENYNLRELQFLQTRLEGLIVKGIKEKRPQEKILIIRRQVNKIIRHIGKITTKGSFK